jgi:diacylglycerol kinase family enzyme
MERVTPPAWVFLINPGSRGGRTRHCLDPLRLHILRAFPGSDVLVPESPELFESTVAEASRAGRRIAVLGGDGTFSLALNGLMAGDPSRTALGLLHHGRGGDFLYTSGFPRRLEPALEALKTAKSAACDCGRITSTMGTRYFLNEASVGLGGAVVRIVRRHPWPLPATMLYFLASLAASLRYRAPRLKITVDGEEIERSFLAVAAANGRYFGGRMHISPASDLFDGRLNLVGLPGWRHPRLLYLSALIYAGRHLGHPEVLHRPMQRIRIEPLEDRPVPIDVDGEEFGTLPAEIEVVPGAFQLLR